MFLQGVLLAALAAFASSSPIEHASSYVSTSFGGHNLEGNSGLGYGEHRVFTAPIITHHQVPVVQHAVPLVHNVVTPVVKKVPVYVHHEEQEEHGPAEYEFHYAVEDKHTGDIKSQKEARHGDQVVGEYSLKEADGTTRIVKYTADKKSGFNAVVLREGHAVHPQVEHKEVQVHKVVVPVKKVAIPVVQHHDDYHQFFSHY